ncbi:hypothetical protein CHUAL_001533 [Chamberlinius hualienensis]
MPETSLNPSDGYSPLIGAVYVFNLIVGTGALTIPAAFSDAGWILGVCVMLLISVMSYMTTTFVIESMAAANAVLKMQESTSSKNVVRTVELSETENELKFDDSINGTVEAIENANETSQLLPNDEIDKEEDFFGVKKELYVIKKRVEMGQMASLFLHKIGVIFFYLSICVYLYGDLAIYGTAVCKTLRDISCSFPINTTCNATLSPSDLCWTSVPITRTNAYRMYLAIFIFLIGPFVFFNVQKTKVLQICTTVLRWLSFSTMIILSLIHLTRGKALPSPKAVYFDNLPNLFGICVYSFMCHHSLPSLITPITYKTNVYRMMALNYSCILGFYLLLALTGVFSFEHVKDLYTLNFEPDRCDPNNPELVTNSAFIQYFLLLFPVFTISPNFPIIGITLKNNLIELLRITMSDRLVNHWVTSASIPLLAIIPPLLVSLSTEELQWLVGITGSFAGVGIQYMIPTMLVIWSRKLCNETIGKHIKNNFQSPFRHYSWPIFALIWSIGCISFNVIRMLMNLYQRLQL